MICLIVIEVFLIVIGVINYTVSTKAVVLTEISKINATEMSSESSTGNYKMSILEYNSLSYYIKVNYKNQLVTIYTTDENGEYTIPVKKMICSTGESTPTEGVFEISDKFEWAYLVGNVYGQYATRITGPILFHSVPYTARDKSTLEYWEFDKLGQPASKGCVRLTVEDSKWIYDYCKAGTKVEFYADDEEHLETNTQMKISEYSDELRNWDPTDPDPRNPWIEYNKHDKGDNE